MEGNKLLENLKVEYNESNLPFIDYNQILDSPNSDGSLREQLKNSISDIKKQVAEADESIIELLPEHGYIAQAKKEDPESFKKIKKLIKEYDEKQKERNSDIKDVLSGLGTVLASSTNEKSIKNNLIPALEALLIATNSPLDICYGTSAECNKQTGGEGESEVIEGVPKINFKEKLEEIRKKIRELVQKLNTIKNEYSGSFKSSIIKAVEIIRPSSTSSELTSEEQNILGTYQYLTDDGEKFIKQTNESLNIIQNELTNLLTEYKTLVNKEDIVKNKFIEEYKKIIEGDLEEQELKSIKSKGILEYINEIISNIATEYKIAIQNIKPIASGLENKKNSSSSRSQQSAYTYGFPGQIVQGVQQQIQQVQQANIETDAQRVEREKLIAERKAEKEKAENQINETISRFDSILEQFTNIESKIKILDASISLNNDGGISVSMREPGLFKKFLSQYELEKTKDEFMAGEILANNLEENDLLPENILAVNTMDKVIFCFVILFIRMFVIQVVDYLIMKGKIKNLEYALLLYVLLYVFVLIAFVACVNIDFYRMRILFNYVNLHSNKVLVYWHILITIGLSILFYIIIKYINFPIMGLYSNANGMEEQAKLCTKIETLTMIIMLFNFITISVF